VAAQLIVPPSSHRRQVFTGRAQRGVTAVAAVKSAIPPKLNGSTVR
jgi:hypothetical protein